MGRLILTGWSGFLAAHGVVLAAVLLLRARRGRGANRVLAGLLLTAAWLLFEQPARVLGLIHDWPLLSRAFYPAWFLLAPLTYGYCRRLTGIGSRLVECVLALPSLALGTLELSYVVESGVREPSAVGLHPGGVWLSAAFSSLLLVSVGLSRRLVGEYDERFQEEHADRGRDQIRWMSSFLLFLLVLLAIAGAANMALRLVPGLTLFRHLLGPSLLGLLVYVTYWRATAFSEAFFRPLPAGDGSKSAPPVSAEAQELAARLERVMTAERLFLEELSLSDLARRLGVSRHQLSTALNAGLGLNYHDYVNRLRVQAAVETLRRQPDTRIIDLGFAVGFGSQSTFYRAFGKFMGTTPARFKRQIAETGAPETRKRSRVPSHGL